MKLVYAFTIASSLLAFATAQNTLADVANANGLTIFIQAAMTTGQFAALQQTTDQLTILAPSDAAFGALPDGSLEWLLQPENLDSLSYILGFHFLPGAVLSSDLENDLEVGGKTFTEILDFYRVTGPLNSADIQTKDLTASNGVLHIIDEVLLPAPTTVLPTLPTTIVQTAQNTGDLSTLVEAITLTNLANALDANTKYTVFAPTDEAFDDLPPGALTYLKRFPNKLREVLLYHVVAGEITSDDLVADVEISTLNPGERLTVNSAEGSNQLLINDMASITAADIFATDGVIHAIDTVLVPPMTDIESSIADIALESADFTTLLLAIEEANLLSALNAAGPFTVFAPNDAAFDKVNNLDTILANNSLLRLILQYHVVPGKITSLNDGDTLTTLSGQTLDIDKSSNGDIRINGNEAMLTGEEIEGSNGIIFTIDTVLIPSTSNPTPTDPTNPTPPPTTAPPSPTPPVSDPGSAAAGRSFGVVATLTAMCMVVAGFL